MLTNQCSLPIPSFRLVSSLLLGKPIRLFVMPRHARVEDVIHEQGDVAGDRVAGVILADGSEIPAKTVILTSGTFLRGVIHIGDVSRPGGRMGDRPSVRLTERLDSFDLPTARLKTGTPPRLDGRTIDWSVLERQEGDEEPTLFSFMSRSVVAPQIACGITHTNARTRKGKKAGIGGKGKK